MKSKTILYAVLDWGLGHATRSIPLIQRIQSEGHQVIVAANGASLQLLKNRLHNVEFVEKPGKTIRYAKSFNTLKIAQQAPSFLASVGDEKVWTHHFVSDHPVDLIISDNCYGVLDPRVPSILITHQLNLPVPSILGGAAKKLIRKLTSGFTSIWVPDSNGMLSGVLSQPDPSGRAIMVGALSQFEMTVEKGDSILVGMVSGPEPHRSILQEGLQKLFLADGRKATIIAGRPSGGSESIENLTILYDSSPEEIAALITGAEVIICRAGYSSLMDLVALKKRAILIPTPGQLEQEFLADHWQEKFGFEILEQHALDKLESIPEVGGVVPALSVNSGAFEELDKLLNQ